MKKLLMPCLSLVMMAACTTNPTGEMLDSESQESVNPQSALDGPSAPLPPGKARVRFVLDGVSFNRVPMTRTDPVGLTDAGVNYLYIYEGEELLLKQVSSAVAEESGSGSGGSGGSGSGDSGDAGSDFGSPSLVLDYGPHTLTFVASEYELDDTDNQVHSGNAFSAGKTVTVDENTATQNVTLTRIKTGIRIVINDSPANIDRVGRIRITLAFPYTTLPPASQVATEQGQPAYIEVPLPQTTPAAYTVYTFCPSLTEVFNQRTVVTMWEKDTNKILSNKSLNIPLLMNRITEVRGTWISTSALITVNTAWGEELIMDNGQLKTDN